MIKKFKIYQFSVESVEDSSIGWAVIVSKYRNQWVFVQHKERDTYETPGGRREKHEAILDWAKRELYEETGAKEFKITTYKEIPMRKKSPGGSTFPYYYKGGEIHCLKYGSFFNDEEALFAVMKAEEEFIAKPNRHLRIWVDFYETHLTAAVILEFEASIQRLCNHIIKLAIVGCSPRDRRRLHQLGQNAVAEFPVKFFRDPEVAKTWLVSEST